MIIKPSFPSGFVTFCDDIRHEVSGKMTLVGVYDGLMMLGGALPITLPQLCAAITFRFLPPTEPTKVAIKAFVAGHEAPFSVMEADIDAVKPDSHPAEIDDLQMQDPESINFAQIVGTHYIQSLVIKKPCVIRIKGYIGSDETLLGQLHIMVAPNSTDNEMQPSESTISI